MSKAFASNDSEDDDFDLQRAPVLPPGTPNYITPTGLAKLEAERKKIFSEKASLEDTVENKHRLKRLERRIGFLTERLNAAQVIDPQKQPTDRVLFGAYVTLQDLKGNSQTWRIVGLDEVDLERGWISWMSPLARALLERRVQETISLGGQPLTLLKITY